LSAAPASAATSIPAASLPVSDTARTAGWAISAATARAGTSNEVTTPSGSPPSRNTRSIASEAPGTDEACLSATTLPAIRAGAAQRNSCQNGKFHGMMASTTPSGSQRTVLRLASLATTRGAR